MPDIGDGESVEVQGSSGTAYSLKNTGGVYSCTCPAWQFQPAAVDVRSCKHLRVYRGDAAEQARVGDASPGRRRAPSPGVATQVSSSSGDAPKLLLAHRYKADIDISQWWMSEKLDGVRAYWDGGQFISRLGNLYLAPEWFTAQFPSTPLDGELFCGRGMFQKTVSVVRRQDRSDDWKTVRYLVFDAPAIHAPFEERMESIRDLLDACASEYIEALGHERCEGNDHLETELAKVEAQGAEGLMLRQPGSPYQVGRSWTLLKVKSFFDTEAKVVAHLEGTGRHMGRLGAVMAELKDGTRFKVGTGFSDHERENPPVIGSIITFRYQELTDGGVPRFPSYVGERHDLAWEQVEALPRRASPTEEASGPQRTLQVPSLGATAIVHRPAPKLEEPPPSVDSSGNIYLEFQKGASVRFWEVEWDGPLVYIEYGRVDREPKTETRTFDDPIAAARFVEKQINAKLEKGYVDDI